MTAIIPASIRNRNPLAQWPGPSARKFGATSFETLRWESKETGTVHTDKIATFPTNVHGAAAAFDLLATSKKYRGKAIKDAIAVWAGGNMVGSYLRLLEQEGVDTLDVLESDYLKDTAKAMKLVKAMARHETGKPFPMSDSEWVAAHEMAFGTAVMPAATPTNDVPTPNPEARAKAEAEAMAAKVGPPVAVGSVGTSLTTSISKAEIGLQQLTSVRGITTGMLGFAGWAMENWLLVVAAVVAYAVFGHFLPKWKETQ